MSEITYEEINEHFQNLEIPILYSQLDKKSIKEQYNTKSNKYHPDKNDNSPESTQVQTKLNLAKEVLIKNFDQAKQIVENHVDDLSNEHLSGFDFKNADVETQKVVGDALLIFEKAGVIGGISETQTYNTEIFEPAGLITTTN